MRVTDIHVHIQPWELLKPEALAFIQHGHPHDAQTIRGFLQSPDKLLAYMDQQGVHRCGLINYPAPDTLGFTEKVNDFVAQYVKGHEDRFIAFGGLDPRRGTAEEARAQVRALRDKGIRALKVHPPHQVVAANDYLRGNAKLRGMYEAAQELEMPVMVHTGTSLFPGARNAFADPMALDDVCQDFPDLQVVMAHGGRALWTREAGFLLRRFENLWLDLSSIPPQRIPEWFPNLFDIRERVLYGSDWPGPGVKQLGDNIRRFQEELALARPLLELIFEENAARLFPEA
ncbi:MAG: amidohydrolase family protein [Halobacteriales archaeon]|nr:amidohydrolase family protein [Halobacteriales archaeon]